MRVRLSARVRVRVPVPVCVHIFATMMYASGAHDVNITKKFIFQASYSDENTYDYN